MPVSSPSYFPTARANDVIVGANSGLGTSNLTRCFLAMNSAGKYTQGLSDLIVIGDGALSAGTAAAPVTDTTLNSSIFIGSNTGAAMTVGGSAGYQTGQTVIGQNALKTAQHAGANVIIGDNVADTTNTTTNNRIDGNVIIGSQAFQGTSTSQGLVNAPNESVVIGFQAVKGASNPNFVGLGFAVVIGSEALASCGGTLANTNFGNCVYIGRRCGYGSAVGFNTNNETWVGYGISGSSTFLRGDNTFVGANIASANQTVHFASVLGSTTSGIGTYTSALGGNIRGNSLSGCILLGAGAGSSGTAIASPDTFLVETVRDDGQRRCILYGTLGRPTGLGGTQTGLIVGASTQGTDRDIPTSSNNVLKILNGTVGTVNPVGGGYFYVSAGALHWVGSSGTDTTLAPA